MSGESPDDRLERLLRSMQPVDFERHDPPPDLWARVAVSTADPQPSTDPPGDEDVIEYRIDPDDNVVPVGRGWSTFAASNQAPELRSGDHRSLWSYFGDDDIREIWRLIIARVRTTGSPATVPLRCDAPRLRRWFDLTITPRPDGWVDFRCELRARQLRPTVELLEADRPRSTDPAIPVCSWCAHGYDGAQWRDIESLVAASGLLEADPLPPISYGICDGCRTAMAAELVVAG